MHSPGRGLTGAVSSGDVIGRSPYALKAGAKGCSILLDTSPALCTGWQQIASGKSELLALASLES